MHLACVSLRSLRAHHAVRPVPLLEDGGKGDTLLTLTSHNTNRVGSPGTALQGLVYDGSGMWLCTRRLQAGSFAWLGEDAGSLRLTRERFNWLVAGLLSQRLGVPPPQSITVV